MSTIPQQLNDRPAVKYINRHVRKNICAAGSHVWLDLGIELLEDEDVAALNAIESSNVSADREVCFSKMLTLWLQRKPNASWKSLIEGLKQILQFKLASDIVDLLDKPNKDVCTYDPLDIISFKDDTKDHESEISIDDVKCEFEEMQKKVLEVLCSKRLDIDLFIDRLKSLSLVPGRSLHAFDDDLFEVESIEALWEKFCVFWCHVFDCHVLEVFLERSCCDEAISVYKTFSSRINRLPAVNELDLVAYYGIYGKMQSFSMSFLKVEFQTERCLKYSIEAIYKGLHEIFHINSHALHLFKIEKGSVYVIFQISERLANYLVMHKDITGYTLRDLFKCNIVLLNLRLSKGI